MTTPSPTPSREERLRPLELIGLAAAMALFTGLGVLLAVRDVGMAGIFAGVAFIVSLVVMSSIAITTRPDADEQRELDAEREVDGGK